MKNSFIGFPFVVCSVTSWPDWSEIFEESLGQECRPPPDPEHKQLSNLIYLHFLINPGNHKAPFTEMCDL